MQDFAGRGAFVTGGASGIGSDQPAAFKRQRFQATKGSPQ